jgi:hypothetical protein
MVPRLRRLLAILSILGVAGAAFGAEEGSSPPPGASKVEEIVLVFKTHFDIGYTGLAREVVNTYRTSMIDQALQVCDRTRALPPQHRFVWTIPGWPMVQILHPDQDAERRKRIEAAVRDGFLVWHALPVTLHTESLELEDLVRGLRFSSELSRRFGQPLPRDAKMTDVPSHVWILPTVLRHAGVDFLHIGCNSASASPELPRLFWWEGPDGSRVLTMYEPSGYGSGLVPPQDWPYRVWLGLIHTGDNAGPPRPEEVQELLRRAAKELPQVQVRIGRLSDFADAILRQAPELPVVRADMPDTWIHGILSMPQATALARTIRPRIFAMEYLGTLLDLWRLGQPGLAEAVAEAYEGSLMYGEHTWGLSTPLDRRLYGQEWQQEYEAGKYARFEESWNEHAAWIYKTQRIVEQGIRSQMEVLARSINYGGPRIVVFNPLPWERDDVVEAIISPADWPRPFPSLLKNVVSGALSPAEWQGDRVRFVARSLPGLGYATFVPAEGSPERTDLSVDPIGAVMENRYFRITLDPARGVILSVVDKRTGREWVDSTSRFGFGQFLYERFDEQRNQDYLKSYCKHIPPWWGHFTRIGLPPASQVPYQAITLRGFETRWKVSPVAVSAQMVTGPVPGLAHRIGLSVRLYSEQPYVELEWEIEGKRPDPWPEAGWLCLPLAIRPAQFRLGRLGCAINPATQVVRGSNQDMFCLSTGMMVIDSALRGIGLCPIHSPLASLGEPGIWRYTREFGVREPVVWINLFNNAWGTNFAQWIGGDWCSGVRLWAAETGDLERDLIIPGWETRSRAIAWAMRADGGPLPVQYSGIEMSCRGVLVTAFGPNPDGEGILLRVWEQAGKERTCRVQLPETLQVSEVWPSDLRGRPQAAAVPVVQGRFEINLPPYAPRSLLIVPEKTPRP